MANERETIGELVHNKNDFIGSGSFGNIVYGGLYNSSRVAIKRMQKEYDKDKSAVQIQEVEHMKKAKDHPYILRIIHTEKNEDFLFIVTELCKGTLEAYVKGTYKGPRFESEREILFQITQGLAYLHELKIVHRDIKPTNILIFLPDGRGSKPVMKLADFGISKELKVGKKDFTNTSPANPNGTKGFLPNEVYESDRFDFKVDVWALGCIFAYTLCGGKHPFGENVDTRLDLIRKENAMLMNQKDMKFPHKWDPQAFAVIKSMLRKDPSKRPTVENVLNHPFFIPYKQRKKHFEQLWNSFQVSVTSDQTVQLEELLLGNSITKSKFELDYTPLHILCRYCKNEKLIDWITLLIEKGADVNAEIHNGDTPLHLLCRNYENDNMIALIKLFIDKGADVNTQNEDGSTPLHYLCLNSFESNSSFNRKDVFHQLLIEKGANVNALDQIKRTPLHLLFENEKKNNDMVGIVSLMIGKGVNVKAEDRYLNTPLHFLCRNKENDNMMALIKLLTEADADVNARDNFKATPLHFLCSYYQNGDLEEVLRFLINECEANVKAKTKNGSTPLHELCCYHKKDDLIGIIQVLIDEGAQVNAKDTNGATPLHIVCTFYNNDKLKDIVQFFIDKCAEVHTKDKNGETPLHKLCRYNNQNNLKDIALLLLEQEDADVNAIDCHGNTPLHYLRTFYKNDNLKLIVQLFMEKGADDNIKKMTKEIGELSYDPNDIIGQGAFGIVYSGFYSKSNEPVAVKQIQRGQVDENYVKIEVELMKKASYYSSILKFVCFEVDTYFIYIATELCRGTLQDYVEGAYNGPTFESEREILWQITQGLAHLHTEKIVHRDIKPTNILIFAPDGAETKPLMKLADFGISKMLMEHKNDYTNTNVENPKGTIGWMTAEVYKKERLDFKVDVWALGCVFAYTLCGGKHPFGDNPAGGRGARGWMAPEICPSQIVGSKVDIFALGLIFGYTLSEGKHPFGDDPDDRVFGFRNKMSFQLARNGLKKPYSPGNGEAFNLIKSMLNTNPDERPNVKDILNSLFFPANRKKLSEIIWSLYKKRIKADGTFDLHKLLMNDSIDFNVILESGYTPLHILCYDYKEDNLIDFVWFLIIGGVHVNTRDCHGRTPLHSLCCYYKNDNLIDIVVLLIKKGAEVNTKKDDDGDTPLHVLCREYKNDNLIVIVHLFIEKGADVNAKNHDGSTPLHLLCCCNMDNAIKGEDNLKSLVRLFLKNGANINEKDNEGKTPNDYLILRKITMFAMESTNLAEPVEVPKTTNFTKNEDETVQSITTTTKALSKEPLQGPSRAHDGDFIRPGTSRKRKMSNHSITIVHPKSAQLLNNEEPVTAQLEPSVSLIVPETASRAQLNQEQIEAQPLNTKYDGPSNSLDDGARNHSGD